LLKRLKGLEVKNQEDNLLIKVKNLWRVLNKMGIKSSKKKSTLAKQSKRSKWAPVWVILKKFGMGKRIHPSAITRHRRSWRRTKLHIKPRKIRKSHFG
jgi:ribosomal protein L39E